MPRSIYYYSLTVNIFYNPLVISKAPLYKEDIEKELTP
jgi:hypothetical protein